MLKSDVVTTSGGSVVSDCKMFALCMEEWLQQEQGVVVVEGDNVDVDGIIIINITGPLFV